MRRARLVMNPNATSTTPRARDVLCQALSSELQLEVVQTRARGHAAELSFDAARSGVDVVVVLGGDGTVNEAVNGLLADGVDVGAPALAVVPGGSTNVFARAIGMPDDHVEATGHLLEALRAGRERVLGLGRADQRWFTFTAGLGLDADVVARVEAKRASGRRSTHSLYVRTALRALAGREARRAVPLHLTDLDEPVDEPVALVLVGNTSPWTYLGRLALDPFPGASFDLGLDLLALPRVRLPGTVLTAGRLLAAPSRPPRGAVHRHDVAALTVTSSEPVAFQVDGDYLGDRQRVSVVAVPKALRVVA